MKKETIENREDETFMLLGDWYVNDLKRKDIDKFERAAIIRRMIDELSIKEGTVISEREFGRRYGIKPHTLQDYLLYNLISEDDYNKLKASGLSASSIYRHIRNKKGTLGSNPHSELLVWAREVRVKARSYKKNNFKYPDNSESVIEEAINEMNSLIVHIRIESKKNRTKNGAV